MLDWFHARIAGSYDALAKQQKASVAPASRGAPSLANNALLFS